MEFLIGGKSPSKNWDPSEPGLVVAYDLALIDEDIYAALKDHRPGQILWSHALCWTQQSPIAPDLVTFLYQMNTAPWDGGLCANPETGMTEQGAPDQRAAKEIAADICNTATDTIDLSDLPALIALVQSAAKLTNEHGAGALASTGQRCIMRSDSPVRSSRFL